MANRPRIGLLGGSFDPPHAGHLWMARRARGRWRLDGIWLLPAWRPPHKQSEAMTAYEHRAAMTALLAEEEPWLELCEVERQRGTRYSLDTVRALKADHGETLDFHLIIGGDSLADLEHWHLPWQLVREVPLLVLAREGSAPDSPFPHEIDTGALHAAQSRRIRADLAAGRDPGAWLTAGVRTYIEREGLYGPSAPSPGGRP